MKFSLPLLPHFSQVKQDLWKNCSGTKRPKFKAQHGRAPPTSARMGRGVPSPFAVSLFLLGLNQKSPFSQCFLSTSPSLSCPPTKCPDPSAYLSWHFLHVCHVPSTVGVVGGGRSGWNINENGSAQTNGGALTPFSPTTALGALFLIPLSYLNQHLLCKHQIQLFHACV